MLLLLEPAWRYDPPRHEGAELLLDAAPFGSGFPKQSDAWASYSQASSRWLGQLIPLLTQRALAVEHHVLGRPSQR